MKKFDVVLGNPPYQKPNSTQKDDSLWPKFLAKSIELGDCVCFVTPDSWGSAGANANDLGSRIAKDNFRPYHVKWVDLTVGRYFKEGSTFSAYEIDTTTKSSSSLLTSIKLEDVSVQHIYMNDFKCIPRQLNEHVLDFLDKTIYSNKQGYNFVGVDAAGPHLGERVSMKTKLDNESFSTEQTNTHPYRTYHTNKQTHVYSPYKNSYHNQLKVLFSYSGSWYKSGEITTDCSTSDASFCVLAPNNDIMYAESVQSVLKSKPIEKLIDKICRWSGYYSYSIISNIPALPTNKIYTDDDVLDAYGITDLESRKFWLS